jgi:hypothetical protein
MNAIAQSIAGSAVLIVGVRLALFGAERGFEGLGGFFLGILGIILVALGLYVLWPIMRLLPRRVIKWRLTRLLPKIDDNPVGTKHTIKVTVEIWDGNKWVAAKDEQVFFQVVEGPNAGRSDTETSDADGQVEFTYLDTGGPGHDVIEIRYTDPAGTTHIQTAFKSWLRKEER